jgi:predicted glycosyltransferase involved in capsule biosynthesis
MTTFESIFLHKTNFRKKQLKMYENAFPKILFCQAKTCKTFITFQKCQNHCTLMYSYSTHTAHYIQEGGDENMARFSC